MKRLIALSIGMMLSAALAFASPGAKPAKVAKPAVAARPAAKLPEVSITGPVKGAPGVKTFQVARQGGSTVVDASKAKIRVNGKFASFSAIKPGTMVTAKGTMQGTTLAATDITVHAPKAAAPAKAPAKAKAPAAKPARK